MTSFVCLLHHDDKDLPIMEDRCKNLGLTINHSVKVNPIKQADHHKIIQQFLVSSHSKLLVIIGETFLHRNIMPLCSFVAGDIDQINGYCIWNLTIRYRTLHILQIHDCFKLCFYPCCI